MSDQTIKLIQLLQEEKTCNEICAILNLSNKQLYNNLTNLRNKGLFYKRNYYYSGDIVYSPVSTIKQIKDCNRAMESTIITTALEQEIKCLLISDLHFGNKLERIDLINKVYDYCIKNGIHIILCCGDMIDGSFTGGEQNIKNIYEQVDYFIRKYPFDKNILTFGVGGDHDYSSIFSGGQDFVEAIKSYRHDIVIGGYNNSYVDIKNDRINLYHHISSENPQPLTSSIKIHGHCHKFSARYGNILHITVPSLSEIGGNLPTAVEMTMNFEKGLIKQVDLKQIMFIDKPYILNEISYFLTKNKGDNTFVKNEEQPRVSSPVIIPETNTNQEKLEEEKPKALVKEEIRPKSQIERFNKRYGLK